MIQAKKLQRLLRAWPYITQRCPHATLDLYGDGPCREGWEELARKLSLGPEVRFHGFVGNVRHALSDIGIFVLPSEGEAYGQVFVEAMLMERPCIGVKSGGVPEVISDGETGLLVPPGDDPRPLAEAIAYLIRNPSLATGMGKAGRRRALAKFVLEVARAKYITLYQSLVEKRQ